ncbi:hypothetical protein RB195_004137 [Necator americanus]|uniref:Uncharacterized protein n=1 Tax=Necator americanus TaxID=51031 RepID=A0ABR1BGT1_NECAM
MFPNSGGDDHGGDDRGDDRDDGDRSGDDRDDHDGVHDYVNRGQLPELGEYPGAPFGYCNRIDVAQRSTFNSGTCLT